MDSYIVRVLNQNDAECFKKIRLEALRKHPDLFFEKHQKAQHYPLDIWKETLDQNKKIVLGVFFNRELVGVSAAFTDRDCPNGDTALFAMSYIKPEHRGKGISKILFRKRLEWAENSEHIKSIVVTHREGNEASRRSILNFGFKYEGREIIEWPDGTKDYDHKYRKIL